MIIYLHIVLIETSHCAGQPVGVCDSIYNKGNLCIDTHTHTHTHTHIHVLAYACVCEHAHHSHSIVSTERLHLGIALTPELVHLHTQTTRQKFILYHSQRVFFLECSLVAAVGSHLAPHWWFLRNILHSIQPVNQLTYTTCIPSGTITLHYCHIQDTTWARWWLNLLSWASWSCRRNTTY